MFRQCTWIQCFKNIFELPNYSSFVKTFSKYFFYVMLNNVVHTAQIKCEKKMFSQYMWVHCFKNIFLWLIHSSFVKTFLNCFYIFMFQNVVNTTQLKCENKMVCQWSFFKNMYKTPIYNSFVNAFSDCVFLMCHFIKIMCTREQLIFEKYVLSMCIDLTVFKVLIAKHEKM